MRTIRIFAAAMLLFVTYALCAQQRKVSEAVWTWHEGVAIPMPPMEHPRLYIRPGGIDDLRARVATPEGKKIIARLTALSVDRTPEEEAAETDHGFRYYFKMRGLTSKVQLQALDYLLTGNRKEARSAITSLLDSLRKCEFGTKQDLSRASGVMLMVGAIVYDWCYPEFTAAEREAYVKEFIRIAGRMECGYPPRGNETVAGHLCEWMVLRDMLSAGIAVYDEYPDMYNHAAKMIYGDYIPVRRYFYAGHNYHQGTSYANVRLTNDFLSLWILDRMGAGPIYGDDMRLMMYDLIYRLRPDGLVLPAGDVNHNRRSPNTYPNPMMLASSYFHDPYLAAQYERNPVMEPHCLIFELLWRDFSLKGKAPDDLPLTMYSGTPYGWMIARTGWDENSVIAEMKVNEKFPGNHQHADGGAFQIYYKGPLAIDSGFYQGLKGGYNSQNNKNYTKRTIAHNSLLVYDPDEVFPIWNYGGEDKTEFAANDGGQRLPGEKWRTCRTYEELLSEEFAVGQVLSHGFGPDPKVPDYTILKGDITKAYSSKVKEVKRSFVFLNLHDKEVPAALVVFDRVVSSNPAFKKYWLLHSIEEPYAEGNSFTVRRTGNGDSGRLQCDVLLPAADNLRLSKVGGEGHEYEVFGVNYADRQKAPDDAGECGSWRVELSPVKPAAEDAFLNVIQVADPGDGKLPAARYFKGSGEGKSGAAALAGALVAGRAVTFSLDGGLVTRAAFVLPEGASLYKVLVTDLEYGTYAVKTSTGTSTVKVSSEEHAAWFTAAPGKVSIWRI